MAGQTPRRPTSYTVPCRCGAYHIVSVSAFGRPQTCNTCRSAYTVVWKRNPKSGAQAPYVIASARRPLKPPPPGPSPESLIQMACNCGYRRKVTTDQFRKLPQCPGCGNLMYVDRPARQKAAGPLLPPKPFIDVTRYAPPSPPAAKPSTPPKTTRIGGKALTSTPKSATARMVLMICSVCGDRLLVRDAKPGRQVNCLRCDGPMAVQAAPAQLEKASFERAPDVKPPPPPPTKRLPKTAAVCPCGEAVDLRGAGPSSVLTCQSCGRSVRMQKSKHPQTLQTLIKPIFDVEPPEPEPTVAAEPGSVEILCECGETLVVSLRDVGHPVQCPGCSMLLQVENTPGGLKTKPMGRIDEQTWSWQDFA